MSSFSKETLEAIASWSEILTAVFGILAASAAVVYLLSNRPLRKIEADESLKEKQKTALAQKEAADSQLALKRYVDSVARRSERRSIDIQPFMKALRNKPRGTVSVLYKENDSEAYGLALQLKRWLGPGENGDGAGWNVVGPAIIPTDIGLSGSGTTSGITIKARDIADQLRPETALSALSNAIGAGLSGGLATSFSTDQDPSLPTNSFMLIIGQKP